MNEAGIDLPFPTSVRVHDAHNIIEAQERKDNDVKKNKTEPAKKEKESEA